MTQLTDLLDDARSSLADANTAILKAEALPPPAPAPAPPPSTSPRTVRRYWQNSDGSCAFDFAHANRYELFVGHWFDSWISQGAKFKAANPNGQAFCYVNVGLAGAATPLDLATARAKGYLAKHNGAEILNPWGGSAYVVDVGKQGAIDDYTDSIVVKWATQGWDGLFLDDANSWANLWASSTSIDGYSSAADFWNLAMLPLIQELAARFPVLPNIGGWSDNPALLDSGALVGIGGLEEHFLTWDNGGVQDPSRAERQYASIRACIAAGKTYHGIVHRTDAQGLLFAWGMAAIMAGDAPQFLRIANQTAYGSVAPTYDPRLDLVLGAPTSAVQHTTGSTKWSRSFELGWTLTCDTGTQGCVIS